MRGINLLSLCSLYLRRARMLMTAYVPKACKTARWILCLPPKWMILGPNHLGVPKPPYYTFINTQTSLDAVTRATSAAVLVVASGKISVPTKVADAADVAVAVEVGEGGDRTMIGTAGEVIGVVETEIADPLRRLKTSLDV